MPEAEGLLILNLVLVAAAAAVRLACAKAGLSMDRIKCSRGRPSKLAPFIPLEIKQDATINFSFAARTAKIDSRYNLLVTLRTFEIGHPVALLDINFGWERRTVALDLKKFGGENLHRKKLRYAVRNPIPYVYSYSAP